jgi:hypothetical protein
VARSLPSCFEAEAHLKLRAVLSVASIVAVEAMGTGVAGASSTPTEYFTAVSTSATANSATVVAAGPISATGTDMQLGAHRDNFVFPNGTLTIRHEPTTDKQTFDGRTCVGTFTETGTYVIARGTGAYGHVTGSGTYKVNAIFQGCDKNAPPTSFVQTVMAHGPLTL